MNRNNNIRIRICIWKAIQKFLQLAGLMFDGKPAATICVGISRSVLTEVGFLLLAQKLGVHPLGVTSIIRSLIRS